MDARIARLQGLGLTENQAKVYLTLLEVGRSSAGPLAKLANVPRNKAYTVIDELSAKGLIEVFLEDPIEVEPRPIDQYVHMLSAELASERKELASAKDLLSEEFPITGTMSEDDLRAGTFRIYKGRRAVSQNYMKMAARAKRSLRVLSTPYMPARARTLGADEAVPFQKIATEIYIPIQDENVDDIDWLHGVVGSKVRITEAAIPNVLIMIVDDRETMVTHFIPDSPSTTSGDDLGVWTDNPVFTQLTGVVVDRARERSHSVATAKALRAAGRRRGTMRILSDEREYRKLFGEAIMNAKHLDVVTKPEVAEQGLEQLGAEQIRAMFRASGTRVRFLTDLSGGLSERIGPFTGEVRHMSPVPARFVIADGHLFRSHAVDVETTTPLDTGNMTLYTTMPEAVAEAQDHFDRLWAQAEPADVPTRSLEARVGGEGPADEEDA